MIEVVFVLLENSYEKVFNTFTSAFCSIDPDNRKIGLFKCHTLHLLNEEKYLKPYVISNLEYSN